MAGHGAGTDWGFHGLPWLVASNITPDPETGIGNVSDDDGEHGGGERNDT